MLLPEEFPLNGVETVFASIAGLAVALVSECVNMIITVPYLLSVCVPIKVDDNGDRWTDRLWAKDLAAHTEYIKNLTLACPRIYASPSSSDVSLNVEPFNRLKFVDLPLPRNHFEAIKRFPETAQKMWRAVSANTIIHTGFGSWPISEGLYAVPMARLQKKFLITYVESSFWRVNGLSSRWHDRLRAVILERLNRICIENANLRFFTSRAYFGEFLPPNSPHSYVAPATWIDESIILDDETLAADWDNKTGPIRLLFAGRLTQEKGLRVFLDAVRAVRESERIQDLSISAIGDGPLKSECQNASNVSLLDPVAYGPEFFNLLRRYDAVVVPSISDEQPRIIFDAFSQGVPVLGSDTGGIREVVEDGIDGLLFAPASPNALADTMKWAGSNRKALQVMGLAALRKSREFTHRSMHQRRSDIIASEYAEVLESHIRRIA
jgi:glycosyltransferase involved in cell wall biosynthesis